MHILDKTIAINNCISILDAKFHNLRDDRTGLIYSNKKEIIKVTNAAFQDFLTKSFDTKKIPILVNPSIKAASTIS